MGTGTRIYSDVPKDARNNVEVAIQDQFTEIIDLYVHVKVDDLTVVTNTSIDDKMVRVETTGETPIANQLVCFKEEASFYQGTITSVAAVSGNTYDLLLDAPLDYPYTTSTIGCLDSADMNVDGSTTPVVFEVSPQGLTRGLSWDITRMLILVRDDLTMDDGKFGGIVGGLTSGVVFRTKNNGTRKNIFTARTNGDFRLRAFDVTYVDATLGPSGQYSFGCRRTFAGQDKNGVTIRLNNDSSPDAFQVIVQDNLTALAYFRVIVQGHVVE